MPAYSGPNEFFFPIGISRLLEHLVQKLLIYEVVQKKRHTIHCLQLAIL